MADWQAAKAEGNALYSKGDYRGAIAKYTEALGHEGISDADRSTLLSNRAQALIKSHESIAAAEDCNAALALQPTNVKALFRRAVANEDLGSKAEAIADYQQVLKLEPAQSDARKALMRLDPSFSTRTSTAPSGGGRRRKMTEEEYKALQEAQQAINVLDRQRQQSMQKMQELAKRSRVNAVTRSEVSKSDPSAAVYRHVGKMFIRADQRDHLKRLDAEKAQIDAQQASLNKVLESLTAKREGAMRALEEAATAAGVKVTRA
jgi:tetratricopeptide (TPR) repeat protein